MPRPQRYNTDVLLEAAAEILASDGPAAVTMSAVARAARAPSGSMYHRFPTRAALCARLWLRSQERFHAGLMAALADATDRQDRCVAGARFVVGWCRDEPVQAQVLLVGADALARDEWPPDALRRYDELRRELDQTLRGLRRRADHDRITAAVIDIPYAIVRRHLRSGAPLPAAAEDIVEDCARALVPRD
ncbi:helix-turn-helix domain-containing protein [Mycobacterium sp.]|jgi:AcrR family transcriptional regulator|uniref:helix-turn-helix domain-containing protein n=1 Tax=Mycobacterium sp. TaxID=1785 RepID=UPI002D69838B|nr:helix-turn-helix domain-containing protein [Mycobacterium sp.]HZA12416.1 helix-turn-helix domain-containing protein [Mycobacterium sp.]